MIMSFRIYDLFEAATGMRMMHIFFRIGGVAADLPHGWIDKCLDFCDYFLTSISEYQKLITRNPIFLEIQTYVTSEGPERVTNEIPHLEAYLLRNLDKNGIVMLGSWVEEGDNLVGKLMPQMVNESMYALKVLFLSSQ